MEIRPSTNNRLLIIDDDPGIGTFVAKVGRALGFATCQCTNAVEFEKGYKEFMPTVVVTDLQMPGVDGIQLLRNLGEKKCTASILIISGMDVKTLGSAKELGKLNGLKIVGCMQKPLALAELRQTLKDAQNEQNPVSEQDLAAAVDEGQLTPYYQPKAARNQKGEWIIDGVESLIRWPHPKHGMIMPDDFIPLAEETGQIVPLTTYVIDHAVRQMVDWHCGGLKLDVSVNVSASTLDEIDFPDRISALMEQYGLDNRMLTLEITESTAMTRQDLILDILTRLRIKGFSLSMDDFGTGYSSLKQLFKLPFSELKIDRSFVKELDNNHEARTLTTAMVTLAHQLGLTVCAEGVETRSALDFLGSLGCDRVQGYLISRPVLPDQIPKCVEDWGKS